jgi:hypothetical protein
MSKKNEKVVVTPRDSMHTRPVIKFPPIPTTEYITVYRCPNTGLLYARPIDFIAVCEYSNESPDLVEIFEGICFFEFENDGAGFFNIIYLDDASGGGRLGVLKSDTMYWCDDKTEKSEPIYKWDSTRQKYTHPEVGDMPRE